MRHPVDEASGRQGAGPPGGRPTSRSRRRPRTIPATRRCSSASLWSTRIARSRDSPLKRQSCSAPTPWFGFHHSVVTSIFDDIPFLQNPRKRGGDHAPEQCIERVLMEMDLCRLTCAKRVTLDLLKLGKEGPRRLSDCCEEEYRSSSDAHFDFVVFDPATGRVAMAIEADGAQHRVDPQSGPARLSAETTPTTGRTRWCDVCHATLSLAGARPRWIAPPGQQRAGANGRG